VFLALTHHAHFHRTILAIATNDREAVVRNITIGRYDHLYIDIVDLGGNDPSIDVNISQHAGRNSKLLKHVRFKMEDPQLCGAWFATYKHTPLLAISAVTRLPYTTVFAINPKTLAFRRILPDFLNGEGKMLNRGIVTEYTPDQYLPDRPKWFHRLNQDHILLVPMVYRFNLRTHTFDETHYDFREAMRHPPTFDTKGEIVQR
jgi:hypothetical protein